MNSEKSDRENRLSKLSIAPESGGPQSTRGKDLEWSAGEHHGDLVLELAALDDHDVYTAIAKGTFPREEAKKLRNDIDEALDFD